MNNLRILREQKKKNQLNVAMNTGTSQEMISKYESGTCYPTVPVLINLAKFFNTSTDYLLGLYDDPTSLKYNTSNKLTKEERIFLSKLNSLSESNKNRVIGYIDALLEED